MERTERILVGALIGAGLVLRLRAASGTFLIPDEALHLLISRAPTLLACWGASLGNAHPPIVFLLLHLFRNAFPSELLLRLPIVLASTGALLSAFFWLRRLVGPSSAIFGLVVLALEPSQVALGAELRGYGLLLLFAVTGLAFLEKALAEDSPGLVFGSCALFALACLTHYSGMFVVGTAGIAFLARRSSPPASVRTVRASLLGIGFAVAAVLALTWRHLSRLRGSPLELEARASWLADAYYDPNRARAATFLARQTFRLFVYAGGWKPVAALLLVLFAVGVATGLRQRGRAALVLAAPIGAAALAGLLGLYPYSGTRHLAILIPFIAGGAAAGLEVASRRVRSAPLVCGMVLAVAWILLPHPPEASGISRSDQRRELLPGALAELMLTVPPGGVILTDHQSSELLRCYSGKEGSLPVSSVGDFRVDDADGRRVFVSLRWIVSVEELAKQIAELKALGEVRAGDDVGVFNGGSRERPLCDELAERPGRLTASSVRSFGRALCVMRLRVP